MCEGGGRIIDLQLLKHVVEVYLGLPPSCDITARPRRSSVKGGGKIVPFYFSVSRLQPGAINITII